MDPGEAVRTDEPQRSRESAGQVPAALDRLREEVAEVARRIAALPDQRSLEARVEALSEGVAALRRTTLTAEEGQRLLARVDNLGSEVAARVGVDAAVAALGVRLGALGSALDQTRLTLLDAMSAAAEPDWALDLRTRLEALLSEAASEPTWASNLRTQLDEIAETVSTEPAWAAGLRARFDALLGANGPDWAIALRARLEAIEDRIEAAANRPPPIDTTGTELIATAMEELSKRLDSDLSELTAMLRRSIDTLIGRIEHIETQQAQQTAAAVSRAEVAATRLEALRAERQQVSAQLEEERRRYREALQPSAESGSEPGPSEWFTDEDRDLGSHG